MTKVDVNLQLDSYCPKKIQDHLIDDVVSFIERKNLASNLTMYLGDLLYDLYIESNNAYM